MLVSILIAIVIVFLILMTASERVEAIYEKQKY